jgi:hypothetical protein
MKNKVHTILAVLLALLTAIAPNIGGAPVYAQDAQVSENAVADRNELTVSVNGTTSSIVAYNIDGYNYFRAADICKALDMNVFPYLSSLGDGLKIVSNEPFDGNGENVPTENRMNVTVKDFNIYFDFGYLVAKAFSVNSRNYVRLTDIVAAANKSYALNLQSVQEQAKNGVGQAITIRATTYDLRAEFESGSNTISIKTSKTDFQRLYEDLYFMEQGKPPIEKVVEVKLPKATPQLVLTTAPEVGVILAKILKDPEAPAYVDGQANYENYTIPYDKSLVGQCTWYARGRFEEVTGVEYPSPTVYDVERINSNELLKVIEEPEKIVERSIAIFGAGHVLFVEYVERDSSGNPNYIYFTEANNGHDGVYRPDIDGKVKKLGFSEFINRQADYDGCIVLR